jgi:hypothetical protein
VREIAGVQGRGGGGREGEIEDIRWRSNRDLSVNECRSLQSEEYFCKEVYGKLKKKISMLSGE